MKIQMWLVKHRDRIYCAWPTKNSAEAYTAGFRDKDAQIIEGYFIDTESIKDDSRPECIRPAYWPE